MSFDDGGCCGRDVDGACALTFVPPDLDRGAFLVSVQPAAFRSPRESSRIFVEEFEV